MTGKLTKHPSPTIVDEKKIVRKITHLYYNDKHLKRIPDQNFKTLSVLYLHNNQIEKIGNLDRASNLISLYLQQNKIRKIENLNNLRKLKKLYLGYNSIGVVEGLENLICLEELHVEKQNLSPGDSLCFDPRSLAAIKNTLKVLNIANNNIVSISNLFCLKSLSEINASNNKLDEIKEVCHTLNNWFYLKEAKFSGNLIAKRHRYREDIIANGSNLEILDGKNISHESRCFIKKFHHEKETHGLKKKINFSETLGDIFKNYSLPIQHAASVSILKDQKNQLLDNDGTIFDEANAVYIPWKALPAPKHSDLNRNKKMTKRRINKSDIKNVFSQQQLF